jgi:hypothetical protein
MNEGGPTKEEKQEHEDAKNRKKEENAPTTKSGIGDDRIDMDTLKKGYNKLKDLIKGNAGKSTFSQRQQGSDESEEMGKPPKKKLPVSENMWLHRGVMVKNYSPLKAKNLKKGGLASSASRRGDGIAQRGKTKGRMV